MMLSSFFLLVLNGAILTVCAVFIGAEVHILLPALMLFLPLLDKKFRKVKLSQANLSVELWLIVASLIGLLIYIEPAQFSVLASIVFFTALPEEWFFRRYLQRQLQTQFTATNFFNRWLSASWLSNIMTSVFFALLHFPSQGLMAISIFIPSLFLGWVYAFKQDLVLVILLHCLFNLFFVIFVYPLL